MNDTSLFLGIDFGTSKCVMSRYNPEKRQAEVLLNHRDERETPSLVYVGQSKSDLLVGNAAVDRLEIEGASSERFVTSVKRDLRAGWRKRLADGTIYEPTDIAASVFRALKQDAEKRHFHGETVTRAVITYPASFDVLQQDAIEEAASKAGFKDIKLLSEPTAAALACKHTDLDVGECLLIYDFGAGTFDVAVVHRKRAGEFSLLMQPNGLKECGGDDLDYKLYAYCDEIARRDLGRSISLNELLDMNFLRICRKRKENLSREQEQVFSDYLANIEGKPRIRFSHKVTRATFEERITPDIKRTVDLTQKMLRNAEQKGIPVDKIILIGGSSQIPLIRRSLASATQVSLLEWQPHQRDFRDFAVALGAAYHGHSIWGTPEVQPSTARKAPPRPKVQPQNAPVIVPAAQKPEVKLPQPQPKKPEITSPLKTPTPITRPAALSSPVIPPTPITRPAAPPSPVIPPTPITRAAALSSPVIPLTPIVRPAPLPPPPQRSTDDGFYIAPRPQRSILTRLLPAVFLLLFSSLAFMEFFKRASVFITPLPFLGHTLNWPVMVGAAILSCLLFGRSALAKLLSFLFLCIFGYATFQLFRDAFSLEVVSPWITANISWPIMAGLAGCTLFLLFLKIRNK